MSRAKNSTVWYLDSTLAIHITNCKDYFIKFAEFKVPKKFGRFEIYGIGCIRMITKYKGEEHNLIMDQVHYAPKFMKNFFSLLAAKDNNPDSVFKSTKTEFWLQFNRTIVMHGKRESDRSSFTVNLTPMAVPTVFPNANIRSTAVNMKTFQNWAVTYGPLNHISASQQYMINYVKFEVPKEICDINDHKMIVGMGNIPALSIINGEICVMKLMDVWHVPQWYGNDLSVLSALNKNPKGVYHSTPTHCYITIKKKIIIRGEREAGGMLQYIAEIKPITITEYNELLGSSSKTRRLYNDAIKKGLYSLFK